MSRLLVILAALCVAFSMAASASSKSDSIKRGLLCIHHYEGSWNDPDAPYWGGLQMDLNFQSTYGYMKIHGTKIPFFKLWGTADHWPIWAQLQAGKNGVKARGWGPWPHTARLCGLL